MLTKVIFVTLAVLPAIVWLPSNRDNARSRAIVASLFLGVTFAAPNSEFRTSSLIAVCVWLLIAAWVDPAKPGSRRMGAFIGPISAWWTMVAVESAVLLQSQSLKRWVLYLGTFVIVAFAVGSIRREADFRRVYRGVLWCAGYQAIVGWYLFIAERRGPWIPADDVDRMNPLPLVKGHIRVMGTMQHPIPFSLFLVIAIVLVVSNVAAIGGAKRLGLALLLLSALYIAGSRSAFIALAAGITVLAVHFTADRKWLRNIASLGLVAGLLALSIGGQVGRVGRELADSGSYLQRKSSMDSFTSLIHRSGLQEMLGSGFGNVETLYREGYLYSPFGFEEVDNWFVYCLGTLGIVGLVAFVVLLIHLIIRGNRVTRALLAVYVMFFFAFDVFIWASMALTFIIVIGAGITQKANLRERSPEASDSSADVTVRAVDRQDQGAHGISDRVTARTPQA